MDRALAALRRGGLPLAEITTDTPGAFDAIERAAAAGHVIGAGTVTTAAQVHDCARAGGAFVVSPGLVPEMVRAALDLGLEPIPGIATATEIIAAQRAGARMMKLFPAGALGVDYLTALRGPFPDVEFVPTSVTRLTDVPALLRAGAVAVGLGTALVGREPPQTDAAADEITRCARELVADVRGLTQP